MIATAADNGSQRIEETRYNQTFRLVNGEPWELYTLVDLHDQEVGHTRPIKIKDTHGKVTNVPWSTLVYPIS